jgi:hypothetical protein
MIKILAAFSIVIMTSIPLAQAKNYLVSKVDYIEPSTNTMIIGDSVYDYTVYLIVQELGASDNQRLPFQRIKVGDWVAFETGYNEANGSEQVRVIKLIKSEREALELIAEQNKD